jgi:hypothetical protein
LPDRDFDTGQKTLAGEYVLTDESYVMLVNRLAKDKFASVSPALRKNLVHFFEDAPEAAPAKNAAAPSKKAREEWRKALENVERLKSMGDTAVPAPTPR